MGTRGEEKIWGEREQERGMRGPRGEGSCGEKEGGWKKGERG
jgi:hypothetical protein